VHSYNVGKKERPSLGAQDSDHEDEPNVDVDDETIQISSSDSDTGETEAPARPRGHKRTSQALEYSDSE
jgi:hypothetical protein